MLEVSLGLGGEAGWYVALFLLLVVWGREGGWCSHWSALASVWVSMDDCLSATGHRCDVRLDWIVLVSSQSISWTSVVTSEDK